MKVTFWGTPFTQYSLLNGTWAKQISPFVPDPPISAVGPTTPQMVA